jgi:signal peptidase I
LGTAIILAVIVSYLPLTVPKFLGYDVFNVVSPSMEPALPLGSAVYTKPMRAEELQPGDVIAYESGDTVITHRVVRNQVVMGELTTKGDANMDEDMTPVPYAALIGRVELTIPLVGRIMTLYSSVIGKVYALVFAGCGVLLNIIAARLRDRRLEREEIEEELANKRRKPPADEDQLQP